MSGMQRFAGDDPGYLEWLGQHPAGFVINTGRTPGAAYLMLHRASCATINGTPARGTTFTGDYVKVCGDREELEAFARQLGGQAQPCGRCLAPAGRRPPSPGTYAAGEVVFARDTAGQAHRAPRLTAGSPTLTRT